ncbi:MAG: hypothetical protein H0A75_01980 [Candidatus Methanofishera endochildressiae]|uniref:Uncharacterized protein n=1 Tax=Candidatus Methanofishera endochildressiae TaxID=2738884 RepID=A0A7Z0MN40_9GAMM|nr:hypothetical protein [Candidatus Methanofishera endochildressiae]
MIAEEKRVYQNARVNKAQVLLEEQRTQDINKRPYYYPVRPVNLIESPVNPIERPVNPITNPLPN